MKSSLKYNSSQVTKKWSFDNIGRDMLVSICVKRLGGTPVRGNTVHVQGPKSKLNYIEALQVNWSDSIIVLQKTFIPEPLMTYIQSLAPP